MHACKISPAIESVRAHIHTNRRYRQTHTAVLATAFMNVTVEIRTLFQQIKFSNSQSALFIGNMAVFPCHLSIEFPFHWHKKQHAWQNL